MIRLAILACLALSACAQSAIQGVVLDPSGAAIPGATITATLEANGSVRTLQTGTDGAYRIPALSVGVYTLRCDKTGFQRAEIREIQLALNQILDQTIQLKLAEAGTAIDVREQPDALDTTATTLSAGLGGEALDETPSQNRSYLGIVLLAPGVAPAAGSNSLLTKAGIRSATPDSGLTVAGMRARSNSLTIDGLDNRDETTGSSRVAVGQEAVAEFRVASASVAPEFGGGAGGNLNLVTLSGTNRFHGDINLFAGDSFLDARNPEAEPGVRPNRREYQPEAALNGPIIRNRTFFAGTIEGELENDQEFSEAPAPASLALINAALSGPLYSRAAVSSVAEGPFPTESTSTQTSLKLTHYLTGSQNIVVRYAFSRAHVGNDVLGTDNFSDRSAYGSSRNQDQSFAAGWQAVGGGTFVNELRFQFARRSVDLTPNSRGALLEIPGVLSIGQSPALDSSRTEDHLQLAESASLARGIHQFGFGASVQRVALDASLASRFAGIFIFPTVADFTRGAPDVFLQAFGDPRTRYSTTPLAFWGQDQIRLAPGLTLVAGVRYEAQILPSPFGAATRNIAPRLGLAWQPHGKGPWVFRLGAGVFYDRYLLGFLNDAIQKDGTHAYEQYAVGADAVRAFELSKGGTLAVPLNGIAHSAYRPDPALDSTPTYSRKLTAGMERALDADTTVTVEYSNIAGYHLPRLRNQALTLPPQFVLEQSASSRYQGMSVTLRRRFTKELTYLIAYTAGDARDDASDFDEQPMNPGNTRLDWSRSRQYQAHRVVASGVFDLPFENLGGPHWLKSLGNRLALAPVISAGSPMPINALSSTDVYRTGAYPITARPDGLARNPFYVRGIFNVDQRLTKGFACGRDHGILLFGLGFYNLTNHTNAIRSSPYYGIASYRGLIEALNARQTQFSFQWEY